MLLFVEFVSRTSSTKLPTSWSNVLIRITVSGGGGWGAKQGLLYEHPEPCVLSRHLSFTWWNANIKAHRSLDPQTTYTTVNEARFDFSSESLEEQQASALGNIANEHSFIQFFLAKESKRESKDQKERPISSSVSIGTTPSTIDEISIPVGNDVRGLEDLYSIPGHFGAVSESGMYYSSNTIHHLPTKDRIERSVKTKIDVPYSYFSQTFRTRMTREEQAMENLKKWGFRLSGDIRGAGGGKTWKSEESDSQKISKTTYAVSPRISSSLTRRFLFSKKLLVSNNVQIYYKNAFVPIQYRITCWYHVQFLVR